MPQAGKSNDIGVYPQEHGFAFGYPGLKSSTDSRLVNQQYEPVVSGEHSVTVSPALMTGSRGYTGRQVTWETLFGTAPGAISAVLEGSIDNTNWTTVDTSANVGGEARTVSSNFQKFRVTIASLTGSATLIVKIAFM